jgi:hypothetical protein
LPACTIRENSVLSDPQVTMSSNSPAQLAATVGVLEMNVTALVTRFVVSFAPVPAVKPFLPSENTTNGALVVSVDAVQVPGSGGTLVMMVVLTVSKFTAAFVLDRQSMVAVRMLPDVVSTRVSGEGVNEHWTGVPLVILTDRTA